MRWRVIWNEPGQWWPSWRDFETEPVARLFAWVIEGIDTTIHYVPATAALVEED